MNVTTLLFSPGHQKFVFLLLASWLGGSALMGSTGIEATVGGSTDIPAAATIPTAADWEEYFPLLFTKVSPAGNAIAAAGTLEITTITPTCTFDPTTGTSSFSVFVEVDYDNSDLVTNPDAIEIILDGAVMTTAVQSTATGTVSVTFPGLSGPAEALPVEARFVSTPTCQDLSSVHLDACTPVCAGGGLGGNVFNDYSYEGADAGALEIGRKNVRVEVYSCDDSTPTYATFTNSDGNWSVPAAAGLEYPVRVEFTLPVEGECFQTGVVGTDNQTSVVFITGPDCNVTHAVVDPNTVCLDTRLATPCYVPGSITAPGVSDALVSYDYDPAGASQFGGMRVLANKDQIGSTWGIAHDQQRDLYYTAAFLKRHVGMGPSGLGAIYVTDPNAATPNASLLFDVGTVDDVGASLIDLSDAARDLGAINAQSGDRQAGALIAKVGLGGLALSDDDAFLYTISLASKRVWQIPTENPTAANVTSFDIPNLSGWDLADGDYRPFAITYRKGKIYVGVQFDAEISQLKSDLEASVYELDLATGTFTEILNFSQDYDFGEANVVADPDDGQFPWTTTPDITRNAFGVFIQYPQPVLSSIEFLEDGTLALGFFDRSGHQFAPGNFYTTTNEEIDANQIAGEVLRVGRNPDNPAAFQVENNASFFTKNGTQITGANGVNNMEGPGGGEFFTGTMFGNHEETGVGGIAYLAGSGEIVLTAMDAEALSENGYTSLSLADGTKTGGITITDLFQKANGLGGLAARCGPLPIEIGNYVWLDLDGDGTQDACEPPLEGVTVSLYREDGANPPVLIATTMTDAMGNYLFSSSTPLTADPNLNWVGTGDDLALRADQDYAILFSGDTGFDNVNGFIEVDGIVYSLTTADSGQGSNPDLNDSDATIQNISGAGTFPAYMTQTMETSVNNHTFDVGFRPVLLSLGSTVFVDNNNDGLQNGADAGIAGVTVQLFDATTMMQVLTDANGVLVTDPADAQPVMTDAMGNYFFSNLPPGDYYVEIPTPPAATPISSNNTGIAFTETDPDDDLDNDDDGIQAASGAFVRSGTITLAAAMEPVNGTTAGTETAQGNTQDDTDDANGNMTLDFGFFAPVQVGDFVFVDVNEDGLQTPGEPGLAGVRVSLIDENGDLVTTDAEGNTISGMTTTDGSGNYLFSNLPPGVYSVTFDISTGDNAEFYEFTTADVGVDEAIDSDNDGVINATTSQSDPSAFLNSGEQDLTLDAGVVCVVDVMLPANRTICSTRSVDLTGVGTITPASLAATWSTPDGDNSAFAPNATFGMATAYVPTAADIARGFVTLVLTTADPNGPCMAASAQFTVNILRVDCGSFFWNGGSTTTTNPQ